MRALSEVIQEMAAARQLVTINGLPRAQSGRRRMRTRLFSSASGPCCRHKLLTLNASTRSGRRFETT